MAKCPDCPPEGAPGWVVTYGDMMTLLLCFFVLLFSFSSMETKKFETVKDTMQGAFGVLAGTSTTMGTGAARKPPKKSDLNFDAAVAEIIMEVEKIKIPQERLEMLKAMKLAASKSLKMVSQEKTEVQKIIQDLEKPKSMTDFRSPNLSDLKSEDSKNQIPRNQSEKEDHNAATMDKKEEQESAKVRMDPDYARGENYDPFRSDATQVDVAPGRDQLMLENTGMQRSKDKLSGRSKPKKGEQDKELHRSEDKDFDYKEPSQQQKTSPEFETLAGLVEMTPHDASHAVFQLSNDILYEPGSVELKEEAKETVFQIFYEKYKKTENSVFQIEAHTDLSFTPSAKYPTSWHLAAARGEAILEFLLEESTEFDPKRFCVVSFGQYQPKYRYLPNQKALPENSRLEVRTFVKP